LCFNDPHYQFNNQDTFFSDDWTGLLLSSHNLSIGIGRTAYQMGSHNPPHPNHLLFAQTAIKVGACDQVIIAPKPYSHQKNHLADSYTRLELLRLLVEDLIPEHERCKILLALLPTDYEGQLALTRQLGHPQDTQVREITSPEGFITSIERRAKELPLPPQITQTHYDVFARQGYEGVTPEFETKLQALGVSYKLHPAPEEKSLSSTMIRNWLKAENWSALAEIYPQRALDFLKEHAEEFAKLVKR
jgi:Cytidylyltransferase-like